MQKIPIQNLYYLLAYSWDSLAEAEEIDLAADDCKSLTDLFARILTQSTAHLLRRGLDRSYVDHSEETTRIRGRFLMSESLGRQSWQRGAMVCEFDELSHDILQNRILKTTITDLIRSRDIAPELKTKLADHAATLRDISPVVLDSRIFRHVPLHRNNRHYRLLLNVCELLFQSRLPEQRDGTTRFRDFIRDDKLMPGLFECFVRNFYRSEQSEFQLPRLNLQWKSEGAPADLAVLPRMRTDVALISSERSIILDCKFYREAMSGNNASKTVHTGNLYQLYAYIRNARFVTGWENSEGILLYPTNGYSFDHTVTLDGHIIRVCSIDLNQHWQKIHNRLLDVISKIHSAPTQ